ncbi:MAG: hypothetical protein FJ333_11135 [Sphingomonadales bacterium]|nr:hypothetical protein [Sphingomonadales bacterium]
MGEAVTSLSVGQMSPDTSTSADGALTPSEALFGRPMSNERKDNFKKIMKLIIEKVDILTILQNYRETILL